MTNLLVYNTDGFSWVRHNRNLREPSQGTVLQSKSCPDAKYSTLCDAFIAAVEAGLNPTHWCQPGGVVMVLFQADHWRKLATQA